MTDTIKLKQVINESGIKLGKLCEIANISRTTLNYKLEGKRDFTLSEIEAICKALSIDKERMLSIFFKF